MGTIDSKFRWVAPKRLELLAHRPISQYAFDLFLSLTPLQISALARIVSIFGLRVTRKSGSPLREKSPFFCQRAICSRSLPVIMLLATPIHPPSFSAQHPSEDSSQYRPAQDFKSLLAPIEFVEGSSTGGLAVPEGKYEPINGTPKAKANVSVLVIYGLLCALEIIFRVMKIRRPRVSQPRNCLRHPRHNRRMAK